MTLHLNNSYNYQPRWTVEAEHKGVYEFDSATDDKSWAVDRTNQLDSHRNVRLSDRAKQRSGSERVRAYGAGYYDLGFKGKTLDSLDHFMDGLIDRLGDLALDRLNDHALETDRAARTRWYAPGGPADLLAGRV